MLLPTIKGHLSQVGAALINLFEVEFRTWFCLSCFKKPLASALTFMIFPAVIINYMIWHFCKNFVRFVKDNFPEEYTEIKIIEVKSTEIKSTEIK